MKRVQSFFSGIYIKKIIIAGVFLFFSAGVLNAINVYAEDWPKFRGNLQNTGYSSCKVADELKLLWNCNIREIGFSSPAVSNGRIFIGSTNGKLYALDENSGNIIWSYQVGDCICSSPAVSNGKVFIASDDQKIYALDEETGELVWSYQVGDSMCCSSPAVSNGKVFIGAENGKLYALNEETGELVWSYQTGGFLTSPAVSNGRVFVASGDGKLYALNEETGELIWSYEMEDAIGRTPSDMGSSPVVAYGKVFIGSDKVYALNEETGELVWSYAAETSIVSSAAVAYGKVFISCFYGHFYALDAETGDLIWEISGIGDEDFFLLACSTVVCDDKVFVVSHYGSCLTLFDEATGQMLNKCKVKDCIMTQPVIVDDKVFFGCSYSGVYAFDVDNAAPVNCSVKINNDVAYTNSTAVTLTLSATDVGSGMGSGAQMQFSNDNVKWSTPDDYATTKSWSLTTGDGTKTVYAKFKDVAGNWSDAVFDTIIVGVDTTLPSVPVVGDYETYTRSTTQLAAAWRSSDPESGIAQYKYCIGTSKGAYDIAGWTQTADTSVTKTGLFLRTGKTYYFSVQAKNGAGLWSDIGYSDGITVDNTSPTGTIKINNDAQYASAISATLTLSAADTGSGMGSGARMQFSKDGIRWSSAEAYTTTKSWTLTTGDGTKTVYAKFMDVAGNWTTASITDTIILDTTAPAITHTPIAQAPKNKSITFKATITDSTSGVKEATLYWRKWVFSWRGWKWSDLRSESMNLQGSVYAVTLTASQVEDRKIKYYIKAIDKAGIAKSTSEYVITRY